MKAVPVSQKKSSLQQEQGKKPQRIPGSPAVASSNTDLTFGGLASPKLDVSYEPMIVKEARYIAITMMKVIVFYLPENLFNKYFIDSNAGHQFYNKLIQSIWGDLKLGLSFAVS